ncbi:hypothetical protein [Methanosarcina sp. WWM596]|nr:hypothetical protein [Methanosarcina sp. WWM596]
MKDDYLTTFVAGGVTNPSPSATYKPGMINIILVVGGIISESAMNGRCYNYCHGS